MASEEFKEFEESEAVAYINNVLTGLGKNTYGEDDLLLLIDAMYDYYEEYDDFDTDHDVEDIDEIVKYVCKTISKDPDNKIVNDDVKDIILAEIEYENSLS